MDLLIAFVIVMCLVWAVHYSPWRRILRRDLPPAVHFLILMAVTAATLSILFISWQKAPPEWAILLNIPIMRLLILAIWVIGLGAVASEMAFTALDSWMDHRDRMIAGEGEGAMFRESLKK